MLDSDRPLVRPARPGDRPGQPAAGQRRLLRLPLRPEQEELRGGRGDRRVAVRRRHPGCAEPDDARRPGARRARAGRGVRRRGGRRAPRRAAARAQRGLRRARARRTARSASSPTWTSAWPRPSAARSRWPSRTPACATRSARRRPPPSARGWRATCTTPSRSRCSPRASRPRPSAAAGGRPPTRRATTSRTSSGSRAARSPRCARCSWRCARTRSPRRRSPRSSSSSPRPPRAARACTVHLDVRGSAQLPQDVSVALFRIAQESLQNVSRHSGASEAWVMLDMTGPVVRLTVRDDGHGFDEATVTPEHFGLAMMRERAEDAGVEVTVESAPGAGTTVTAEWRRGRWRAMNEGGAGAGRRRREAGSRSSSSTTTCWCAAGSRSCSGMFDDIELVGQAGDGEEAVRLCARAPPGRRAHGPRHARHVRRGGHAAASSPRAPSTKVVALTSFTEDDLIGETLRAGAIGYLMKNVSADQLADAVRAAHAGALDAGARGRRRARALGLRAARPGATRSPRASARCSSSWPTGSPTPTSPSAS